MPLMLFPFLLLFQFKHNVINFNRSPLKNGDLFFSTPNKNYFSKTLDKPRHMCGRSRY